MTDLFLSRVSSGDLIGRPDYPPKSPDLVETSSVVDNVAERNGHIAHATKGFDAVDQATRVVDKHMVSDQTTVTVPVTRNAKHTVSDQATVTVPTAKDTKHTVSDQATVTVPTVKDTKHTVSDQATVTVPNAKNTKHTVFDQATVTVPTAKDTKHTVFDQATVTVPVTRNAKSMVFDQATVTVPAIDDDRTQKLADRRRKGSASDKQIDTVLSSLPTIYDLTVVSPTRNEQENVVPLLNALKMALTGINVEVIFVDDSNDETPNIINTAARTLGSSSFRIHLEHRLPGPARAGGLATAVDLGLKLAQAKYVAVIDADLQHPPEQLRVFYDEAIKQDVDLVLASRYIKGGSYGGLDGFSRLLFSLGLKWTAKILFPEQLAQVSDPLGGFFLLRRSLLTDVSLRPIGYKILLEILIRCQWKSLAEVPYHFQQRVNGQSKADIRQGIWALQHMLRLWREVPAAGRVWKIGLLLLMNAIAAFSTFIVSDNFPFLWDNLHVVILAAFVLLNFVILDSAIFPRASKSITLSEAGEPTPDYTFIEPSPVASIDNLETSKLVVAKTSLRQGILQKLRLPAKSAKLNVLFALSVVIVLVAVMRIGYTALDWVRYALPSPWLILATFCLGLSITRVTTYKNVNVQRAITMLLALAVGVTFVDYVTWRFAVTNWVAWWIALPLLGAETLGAIHTLGLQYTLWPRDKPQLLREEDPTQFPIFVFIPTVSEGVEILEATLHGILGARSRYLERYPHAEVTIVLCNDGYVAKVPDWEEAEHLARRFGVRCITRRTPGGAKAGNIENARQQVGATGNALLLIFDADQIAYENFLLQTIPPFADSHVGWVQTGQYYRNLDNPVSRWADDQQSMFYSLLCPGKASLNSSFICGTNVVIRASALDEIGGFPQDSVTEDFAASISLHSHWKSIFLSEVLATGLGPMDVPSYLKQQRRWAIGTLGVLRTKWRDVFLPWRNGLTVGQRIQYFLACTHYLCGLRDFIYLLSPLLFIILGVPAVHGSTLGSFVLHFLPYFLATGVTLWYAGRGLTGLRGIVIGFGCFPVLMESLLSVVLQRKVGFAVTSKQRGTKRSWSHMWIYMFFLAASIVCGVIATQLRTVEPTSLLISGMWIVYSMVMLSSFLWLCISDMRAQSAALASSGAGADPLSLQTSYPDRLQLRETGLRPVWNLVVAAMMASLLLASSFWHVSLTQPTTFVVNRSASPMLGVSLPVQFLATRPAQLEQKIGTHLSIIGRTQDIHDQFDLTWANNLAAHQERPWITLEFGVPQANGKPPISASLPAITNGIDDDMIQRWAQSIHDYGRPVYLTVLLHVDRNWSLSSAVANGGIPHDSSAAWTHVQSLFKSAGATNVAWVWSPADPAHDQIYAPPASTIDVVLLSLISYPKTQWVNPQTTLNNVVRRYPTKPIILEVSADGSAAQKSAWLQKVGLAVHATPAIYALIYHDAAPGARPTARDNSLWSISSDSASLQTMRQIATNINKHK